MLKAIHKESGELISSFKLIRNTLWIGKEREEFIAPRHEIGNWQHLKNKGIEEVKVSFVKHHKRKINGEETGVVAHFRKECDEAIINPLNESEEHLLAKEGIYESILENKIIVDGNLIGDISEIDDVDIEHRLSPTKKSKIADVCVTFKKQHLIYGKGIVFEIQFSNQNEEKTEERTYDRVLQGYSVVWLWEGNFKDNKLINNNLEVIHFLKAIKEFKDKNKSEWINDLILFKEERKKQYNDFENKMLSVLQKFNEKTDASLEYLKEVDEKRRTYLKDQEKYTLNIIKESKEQIFEEINKKKEEIIYEISNKDEIKEAIIKSLNMDDIIFRVKKELFEQIKEGVLKLTAQEVEDYLINKLDLNEIYNNIDIEIKKVIPSILDKIGYKGYYKIPCGNCSKEINLSSSKFKGTFLCRDCLNNHQIARTPLWQIRDNEEKKKEIIKRGINPLIKRRVDGNKEIES